MCQAKFSQNGSSRCVYRVLAPVGEVKLRLLRLERHSRTFRHHLHVDGLARLHADHQLVAVDVGVAEDVAAHVAKLDAHFGLAFVQR